MLEQIFTQPFFTPPFLTPGGVVQTVVGALVALTVSTWAQRRAGSSSPASPPLRLFQRPSQRAANAAETPPGSCFAAEKPPPLPVYQTPRDPIEAFQVDQLVHRRRIAPIKAAHMLIEFMQAHEATGYFTPKEIDAWWALMVYEDKLDALHPNVVRSELAAIPNTWIGLKRLNAPEFRAVKARTGKDRSILYRIPSDRIDAGAGTGETRSRRAAPAQGPENARQIHKSESYQRRLPTIWRR